MAAKQLGTGNPDGTIVGRSDDKLGFYGTTPVVQASAITSLTDSTTGTAGDTCNDTTTGTKDDLASIIAKVNGIILALRNAGIIAS